MRQTDLVSGFSELKDILIRAYEIDRPRNQIKLYFSQDDDELLMHDYSDHKNAVTLVESMQKKLVLPFKEKRAVALIFEALDADNPVGFLNDDFKLNGFFLP